MPFKGFLFPALCIGNERLSNQTVLISHDEKIISIEPFKNETEGISYIDGIALVLDKKAMYCKSEIIAAAISMTAGLLPFDAAAIILKNKLYTKYKSYKIENSILVVVKSHEWGNDQ